MDAAHRLRHDAGRMTHSTRTVYVNTNPRGMVHEISCKWLNSVLNTYPAKQAVSTSCPPTRFVEQEALLAVLGESPLEPVAARMTTVNIRKWAPGAWADGVPHAPAVYAMHAGEPPRAWVA